MALFDGNRWVTPAHPLLKGTMRQSLIDKGLLKEKDIMAEDFPKYLEVRLINAMMSL
ncbi:MAG: aminotransferase class IV [Prevotella sp.]